MAAASLQELLSGKCGQIVRLNCGKAGAGTREATSERREKSKMAQGARRKGFSKAYTAVLSLVLSLRYGFRPTTGFGRPGAACSNGWRKGGSEGGVDRFRDAVDDLMFGPGNALQLRSIWPTFSRPVIPSRAGTHPGLDVSSTSRPWCSRLAEPGHDARAAGSGFLVGSAAPETLWSE